MKSNTNLSSNKWVKYLTVGGIGLAFIGASYSIMKILKKRQQTLPKSLVLKILQELRYEAFPIFFRYCTERQAADSTGNIPPDVKKELLDASKSNRMLITLIHAENG